MSSRRDIDYLQDILEAANRITSYIDQLSYEDFVEDHKTQDAVVRNLEIIGEAAKHVSDSLRILAGEIPWKNIAGMRDRLIHGYFGVNWDIVWSVAIQEIPYLRKALKALVSDVESDSDNCI